MDERINGRAPKGPQEDRREPWMSDEEKAFDEYRHGRPLFWMDRKRMILEIKESPAKERARAVAERLMKRLKLVFLDRCSDREVLEAYLQHALSLGGCRDARNVKDILQAYLSDYDMVELEILRDGIALGVYLATVYSEPMESFPVSCGVGGVVVDEKEGAFKPNDMEIEVSYGQGEHHPRAVIRCHGKLDPIFKEGDNEVKK